MAQTKVTGGLISTTSNYEVGVITATKFVGPFEGTTATFTGDVDIKGTLSYVDVDNITATGIITAQDSVQIGAGQVSCQGSTIRENRLSSNMLGAAEYCQAPRCGVLLYGSIVARTLQVTRRARISPGADCTIGVDSYV